MFAPLTEAASDAGTRAFDIDVCQICVDFPTLHDQEEHGRGTVEACALLRGSKGQTSMLQRFTHTIGRKLTRAEHVHQLADLGACNEDTARIVVEINGQLIGAAEGDVLLQKCL